MKKNLVITLIVLLNICNASAQVNRPAREVNDTASIPVKKPARTTGTPATTTPSTTKPAVQTKTLPTGTGATTSTAYYLTSARVSIKTGQDNKEFPSIVSVYISINSRNTWREVFIQKSQNEMRSNSVTEIGLEKGNRQDVPLEDYELATFQRDGMRLTIFYGPNLFTDAWKIEGVTLTIEFKDASGNPHPVYGKKTITFNNAYGFLNNAYWNMVCTMDSSFEPLTANIIAR